jgi:hypothetical protein
MAQVKGVDGTAQFLEPTTSEDLKGSKFPKVATTDKAALLAKR